ncbi:MAG: hypothetical protein AAF483_18260 [Planctomycetota bacterium]
MTTAPMRILLSRAGSQQLRIIFRFLSAVLFFESFCASAQAQETPAIEAQASLPATAPTPKSTNLDVPYSSYFSEPDSGSILKPSARLTLQPEPVEESPEFVELPSVGSEAVEHSIELAEESYLVEVCECGDCDSCEARRQVSFGDWLGYNSTDSDTTWLIGDGDELGIFSLENYPHLSMDDDSAIMLGMSIHWVNGPIATDLPPRLYDLALAYQRRKVLSSQLIYDMRVGVGAFTDFEGSVRKGIRFPGHFVSYFEWDPYFITVLGVEALDRDDISVLPVGGFVWRPNRNLVIEAVFPRPKIHHRIFSNHNLYLGGELGGGTWAIERDGGWNDNATYRDLRLILGAHDLSDDSSWEFGWSFARELSYRSGFGNYEPDDTFLLRIRHLY